MVLTKNKKIAYAVLVCVMLLVVTTGAIKGRGILPSRSGSEVKDDRLSISQQIGNRKVVIRMGMTKHKVDELLV